MIELRKSAPKRSTLEAEIQHAIREALGQEPGLILWRNHQGMVREVDEKEVEHTSRAGLPRGSADLIGTLKYSECRSCGGTGILVARPEFGWASRACYSCSPIGRFIALEVKRPGLDATPEQKRWMAQIRNETGAFACVVHSVEEAKAAIERARRGEYE